MMQRRTFTLTGTSPAAAGQAVIQTEGGLGAYDWFQIDADLVGATGGTLDIYLQRKLDTDVWLDWVHLPQLAAGAAAVRYSLTVSSSNTIVAVGKTSDAGVGTPALAANTSVGGHPGDKVRVMAVAGASTSAGATVTVYVSAFKQVS